MPSIQNKAVLVDAHVYVAANNVKRSVATFAINSLSTNGDVTIADTIVLQNGSYPFTGRPGNKLTLVRTQRPLVANITLPDSQVVVMTINSLMVISQEVSSITFENEDADNASQLTVIQA